jgi:hypothetical protein
LAVKFHQPIEWHATAERGSHGFGPFEVLLEKLNFNEKKYLVEKAKGSARKYTET